MSSFSPNMNSSPSTNIIRQRLAVHLLGARVSVEDAINAATRLEPHLDPPSAMEHVRPGDDRGAMPLLFQPPAQIARRPIPTALFEQCPDLSAADVPHEWIPPFLCWGIRYQRWQQFVEGKMILEGQSSGELLINDAVVAGLLLFQCAPRPDSPLRQHLRTEALKLPFGAYLVAESHHTSDERLTIIEALRRHSRMLHWASRLPHFAGACASHARQDLTLWSGLTLGRGAVEPDVLKSWLEQVAQRAGQLPAAAVAALVLQPAAPPAQQQLWINTLSRPAAARWAFEAAWWTRHTWTPDAWAKLRAQLRPYATSERGQWWWHWSLLEPEWVTADFNHAPADPLWAVELLCSQRARRLPISDQPLRNQMVDRLVADHGDAIASLVLRTLNHIGDDGGSAQ